MPGWSTKKEALQYLTDQELIQELKSRGYIGGWFNREAVRNIIQEVEEHNFESPEDMDTAKLTEATDTFLEIHGRDVEYEVITAVSETIANRWESVGLAEYYDFSKSAGRQAR